MTQRLLWVALVVAIAAVAGLVVQWRQGRVRTSGVDTGGHDVAALLFTTPTCRTCPQVRDALAAVADAHPRFRWAEVDAAADLDRARAHRVLRAPTVVFHLPDGTEVARASGAMTRADIATAAGLAADDVCTAA